MKNIVQDLRFSARMLYKTLGVSVIAAITLALGIGANTAIFTLLDQVMLRRLPVEKPQELVLLRSQGPMRGSISSDSDQYTSFSYPMYKALREKNSVFAGLIGKFGVSLSLSMGGQTERASGELVSGNYFEVLGVKPALGRVFSFEDDKLAGAHPIAVLGHAYWTTRFGRNPSALNQTILVNGHTLTIVGVAQAGFNGVQVGSSPDVFIPLSMKAQMTPNWDGLENWNDYWLPLIGRLKPGMSREQAVAGLLPTYRGLLEEQAARAERMTAEERARFAAKPIELLPGAQGRMVLQRDAGFPLTVLFGMVFLVLLIACTNVANLLFVRGLGRQRELAIRMALGASRWTLMRQLLIESLLLSLTGGFLGLLASVWISDAIIKTIDDGSLGRALSSTPDRRILLFTFALSTATGLLFGLIPAWRVTRGDMTPALKDQSAASSASRSQARLRKSMVATQVALTMLLLVGAGLMTRSLWNLRRVDLGLKPEQIVSFAVAPSLSGYDPAKTSDFADQLLAGLKNVPGVLGVGLTTMSILANNNWGSNVTPEGATDDLNVNRNCVGPGYFAALGTPLLMGRDFTQADTTKSQKVAVINKTAADRMFPNQNPIGRRFAFGAGRVTPDIEVVGVVKDSKMASVKEEPRPFVYQPYTQHPSLGELNVYVRSQQDPAAVAPSLRKEVQRLDPNMPVFNVKTLETVIGENLLNERMVAYLSICFGALAALLAGVGLYGVLSHWVVQRTREIGVRMALGAQASSIRWLVLGQGVKLTLVGVVIGLLAGFGLTRFLGTLLYGVQAADLVSYVIAGVLLTAIALLACFIPARRATKVDPMVALRVD
jgi:predicted permease